MKNNFQDGLVPAIKKTFSGVDGTETEWLNKLEIVHSNISEIKSALFITVHIVERILRGVWSFCMTSLKKCDWSFKLRFTWVGLIL